MEPKCFKTGRKPWTWLPGWLCGWKTALPLMQEKGAVVTSDGIHELDAAVMDGSNLMAGAVARG